MMPPLILVTNDDGIDSPGLHAAIVAAAPLGELLIAAPHSQQTSMGRAMPVGTEVGVIETRRLELGDREFEAYAIHGSPAQAVLHALQEIAPRRPDLCISGVNYGENIGSSLTRSGTVGAALEASSVGIPAIAVSLQLPLEIQHTSHYAEVDWNMAMYFLGRLAARVLERVLPAGVGVLNLNVPRGATTQTPVRITRQSRQSYYQEYKPPTRDFATPYRFRSQITFDRETLEADSDIYALAVEQAVSLTPLSLDLTARTPLPDWYSAE